MKKLLVIILLVIFPQLGQAALNKGELAPNFFLTTQDGKNIELYQIRGKVILIEFLSNKCFACDYVIPDINSLYKKFKSEDVQIIGVLFNDEIKDTYKLTEFAKDRGIEYPLFIADVKVKKLYNVYGFPNFFILKNKRIAQIYRGITKNTFELLNKDIDSLLRR